MNTSTGRYYFLKSYLKIFFRHLMGVGAFVNIEKKN